MPRESGGIEYSQQSKLIEAVAGGKAGGYWVARFRGR
jgi:hypothetical protein